MPPDTNRSWPANSEPASVLPYRLRLPGPAAVPERVRAATAEPILSHRGPEFRAALAEIEQLVQPLFGTRNRILTFASSGSGMMEAGLANVAAVGERVLITSHGQFGERFASIAKAFGMDVDMLEVPWGEAIDPLAIETRIKQQNYRAVVLIHSESSTGVVADLAAIGKVLHENPALLVVDSVSGLGGIELRQDEWGVDILVTAGQKCLMCPPGLGLASVSEKAWALIDREKGAQRFYFDFRRSRDSLVKAETPFTAPVSLMLGLREALRMIHAEGIPQVFARHQRLSEALRTGAAAIGLKSFPRAPMLSSTVSVFDVPVGLKGSAIVRRLYEKHRTVIAGARNRLDGRVIRIGTMGHVHDGDILTDLLHLEDVLAELGHPLERGAGVAAAAKALSL
jgi:aspartate aminotransferase-like enzyme